MVSLSGSSPIISRLGANTSATFLGNRVITGIYRYASGSPVLLFATIVKQIGSNAVFKASTRTFEAFSITLPT